MNQAVSVKASQGKAVQSHSLSGEQLRLEGLSKSFGHQAPAVVRELSLELPPGEILALLGPSGCGKTTTLRLIAGFEKPDQGRITLNGQDITEARPQDRNIGIVFQDYALIPHMTVMQNVCFGMRQLSKKERPARAAYWLELMQLSELADRYPHELSGGQQQRVALARTLAAEPHLVLLDEPFSNLDTGLREATRNEMRALFKRTGTSVILVTHDQAEALSFADRVGVMNKGSLCQLDTPQTIYQHPVNAFVAEFLGHTNLISGEAAGREAQTSLGRVRLDRHAEGLIQASLRPEHVRLISDQSGDGQIISREFRGHDYFYQVRCDDHIYKALAPFDCCLEPGSRVRLEAIQPAVVLTEGSTG